MVQGEESVHKRYELWHISLYKSVHWNLKINAPEECLPAHFCYDIC